MAPAGDVETTKQQHTPMQMPHGEVLSGSPADLHELANKALKDGENTKALHIYTMAIDALAREMPRNKDGVAEEKDIIQLNKASDGRLVKLLSNRSLVHSKVGDSAAAIEDAETCVCADPAFEKGHARLVAALGVADAPAQQRLAACERGLSNCPDSEILVKMKWNLKKLIASQPATVEQNESTELEEVADDVDGETCLRRRAQHGDVNARRELGLLLLRSERPVEAAAELRCAADEGDEQAERVLAQLMDEVRVKEEEARKKLDELAAGGDPRAVAMLQELCVH